MIEVAVGNQGNGAAFELTYETRRMLEARIPGWSSGLSIVFLASKGRWDFGCMQDPMWAQVVMLLTGLREEQIRDLGGFTFVSPEEEDEVIYESHAA